MASTEDNKAAPMPVIPRKAASVHSPARNQDPDRVGWMRQVLPLRGVDAPQSVGPFLLLDHWGGTYHPHEAVSGSDHPHRGQETVSYILKGGIHHQDSKGFEGRLSEGWVQWMTAGSGVMHSEMHSDELWENGGTCEGFQIWVNLRANEKMVTPRYQDTPPSRIPVVKTRDGRGTVKVIAGGTLGISATIETRTPLHLLDITLEKGASFTHAGLPASFEGLIYVYEGACKAVASVPAKAGQCVVLGLEGDSVVIESSESEGCKALLLAGEPLGEPVAWHGPFVLNTQDQVQQTLRDYQSGAFGEIPGKLLRQKKRAEARRNIDRRLAGHRHTDL